MILHLIRQNYTKDSTIGSLYIDNEFFCYVLEDCDRGLNQDMSLLEIKARKIFGVTAIPTGTYKVITSMSARMKRLLPEVLGVSGYTGIRIHRGNYASDSLGCLIVGMRKAYNSVFDSTIAETALMRKLKGQKDITLVISRRKE